MYFMNGDIERVLYPDEMEFIAADTDFICNEKFHGFNEMEASDFK